MCIGLHLSARYFYQILIKLELAYRFSKKKSSNTKFCESHEVGDELFHVDGWTDRHNEVNIRLSQFGECNSDRS
jgi:hypothetical protein